jgi:hypothetical protein
VEKRGRVGWQADGKGNIVCFSSVSFQTASQLDKLHGLYMAYSIHLGIPFLMLAKALRRCVIPPNMSQAS